MAELTKFPLTTESPQIEVTLPVGKNVLELVVEDSAGLRSEPDRVTITVIHQHAMPAIRGISPTSGKAGTSFKAMIYGNNLQGATAVTFDGSGVMAHITSNTDPEELTVEITIEDTAPAGSRTFSVTTPAGTATSPAGVVFTVDTSVTPPGPITPVTPPVTAVTPVTPVSPVTPVTPVSPVTPASPISPVTPVIPVTGETPVTPVTGTTPIAPVTSVEPVAPVSPIGPVPRDGSDTPETPPLRTIKGIGETYEEKLVSAGIRDIADLSKAAPEEVASILGLRNTEKAKAIIAEAARLLEQG